jgi:GH43 family beta-xylosidase
MLIVLSHRSIGSRLRGNDGLDADTGLFLEELMRSAYRLAIVLAATFACAAPAVQAAEVQFHNPIVRQRADAQAMLHSDGYYYFTATVPEYDRIEVRRARSLDDLGGKAEVKVVWRKHAHGEMGAHIWAPEIHNIGGKWYIYFTSAPAEHPWEIRIYVLENDAADPFTGKWIERGELHTGWESFALDATTFVVKGQRYLAWAQRTPQELQATVGKGTNIYIAKMDSPVSIVGPAVMVSHPEYAWEKVKYDVNEGPAVLVKNGKVFLTYSASATDANYCMGMLQASADANLLDPSVWKKSPQPVFKTSAANGVFGPGHNAFTTTPDGKTDVLIYHARSYSEIKGDPLNDPNRDTRAQVIHWRADGTPDFGEPVRDQTRAVMAN